MQTTLIDQGLSLMLYGMGTVFVFLTILVFATGLMSSIVRRLTPAEDSVATSTSAARSSDSDHMPEAIQKAIEQAIALHRQR